MTMSEYEERFRSQALSLHQAFAASRGSNRGPNRRRGRSRHLWVAAALAGVIAMACKIASHQTVHSGTGDGFQADFLSEGRCGAVLLAPVMSIEAKIYRHRSDRRSDLIRPAGQLPQRNRGGSKPCLESVAPSHLWTSCLKISQCDFLCDAMV